MERIDIMQQAEVRFIGVVHCDILRPEDAPPFYDESERTGVLEIFPEYHDGLAGIAAGQTITTLFWLHLADRSTLKVYPRGDRTKGLHGVFATRSPMRPNPIAVSELRVLAVNGGSIEVSGLDIINGTPILDLKKRMKG
ncbi:tRNA (N6-threonylcarbamoyladenosine(37)-N6)-methyltransferase TrmO [Candidatus Electronema sp. TJ]|uniref:tRNA (N6-threonylcarbamoyladenosine(37)-N6)-methyltransferase TrmO n=1 Tax=Candidatus Electronema sp. TJ TaxID=3401573 RepID=UPI003AA8D24B